MNNYNENVEKNLIELAKQKEEADRRLLNTEIIMGVPLVVLFLGVMLIASKFEMDTWVRFAIIISDVIVFLIATFFMVGIEQKAGYYECQKCHHKYVPSYSSVCLAMHFGRTRYMKCPKCNQKSWQKKVTK